VLSRPPAFHVLVKPTGARCNLDCSYCFFLSKEMLYPGSRFRMADELLEDYLRQLIEGHTAPEVQVAWQGGEPTLMGLAFFERSIELVEKYRKPGVRVIYSLQTNGTLIDEGWARFLRRHNFLVGISIDGPQPLHDVYRVDKGNQPTFDKVLRGLRSLQEQGVEYNTLTTLHRANADHPLEVYRFLRDKCHSRFLQFIPILERVPAGGQESAAPGSSWRERPLYRQAGDQVTDRSLRPEQYGDFLIGVFEEWVRHDVGRVYVQMFDVALANWLDEPPGLCVHAQTCGLALAIEHNGDLYSCDHFVEPEYRLGNILETPLIELVTSPQQQRFGREKLDSLPAYCRACEVRFACHGGCPKDRFLTTPEGEPGLNYLCAGFKRFFHHVDEPMRRMVALLRQRRAPAEIMQHYQEQDRRLAAALAGAGRNDPCPCGSGKKFKQCHGRL